MMSNTSRPISFVCMLMLVIGLYSRPVGALDRVFPLQGPPASGTVQSISNTQVVINVRGKDQTFKISEVRKITFDGEPSELDRAREQVILEQFDQALEELKKIPGGNAPPIQHDVDFYTHYCEGKLALAGTGDRKRASDSLLAVASANRNTHHLFDIAELLGDLALASGDVRAKTFYEKLATADDPSTRARGEYRLGQVELLAGNTQEAKLQFQKLASSQSSTPEMAKLKNLAEVGIAACDLKDGDAAGAIKKLDSLVAKNDSANQALFAKIFNTKGAAHASLGQTDQAILSYLRTDLLFFSDPEAHAESLYFLSKLWPKIGKAARAAEAKERMNKLYASSQWANKQ